MKYKRGHKIKFRAWDKEMKVMDYNPQAIHYDCDSEINTEFENPRFYFMQYTGLKDKNGVEIYEGDIIKSETSYPLEVYWMGIAWGVRWIDGDSKEEEMIHDDAGDMSFEKGNILIYMEVIGNRFENPELLTNK